MKLWETYEKASDFFLDFDFWCCFDKKKTCGFFNDFLGDLGGISQR
jgi:hypothetical protein